MRTCPVFQAGPVPDVPHLRSGFRRRTAGSTMADKPVRLCRRSLKGEGASPCIFGLGFWKHVPTFLSGTPPHNDALLSRHSFMRRRLPFLLAFGELLITPRRDYANTWYGDFHPASYVPCLAHTTEVTGVKKRSETELFNVRLTDCLYGRKFSLYQMFVSVHLLIDRFWRLLPIPFFDLRLVNTRNRMFSHLDHTSILLRSSHNCPPRHR